MTIQGLFLSKVLHLPRIAIPRPTTPKSVVVLCPSGTLEGDERRRGACSLNVWMTLGLLIAPVRRVTVLHDKTDTGWLIQQGQCPQCSVIRTGMFTPPQALGDRLIMRSIGWSNLLASVMELQNKAPPFHDHSFHLFHLSFCPSCA